ncbi:MAG: type III-A CRISPR-associated protein Csm2 [Dialister sp.]|nr:type III-A CRISPR-associated protein Csm2 [Dialister sp.]
MLEENQIVDRAEEVMRTLSQSKNMVTTSQIRKFLTAVNTVKEKISMYQMDNKEQNDLLPVSLQAQIKYLKVKLAYQIGRNKEKYGNPVEAFEKEAGLMKWIDEIKGSAKEYDKFSNYIEALVAYHKFYGGKD